MGTYRIDLIIAGKNQLASVMNSAAGTVQAGASKMKSHLDSVGETGSTLGSKIKAGASVGANGLSTLGTSGTRAGSLIAHGATRGEKGLEALAHRGETTGHAIAQGAEVGVKALDKVSEAGGKAGANVAKGGQVGAAGLNNISRAGSGAISTMDGLNTVIGGVIGGFGMMTIATAAWSGSSSAEFNRAYLATKVGEEAAGQYVSTIQQIVAAVPGDDSFMNTLMTGALARQTTLSTEELNSLGNAAADYLIVSQSQGKSAIETQMDLKEYVQTGNTAQLERDSILKNQMSTLEGQGTVSERINALNQALNDEGYKGLSTLDTTNLKWEETKGKIQASATALGEKVLPYVSKFLDFVLDLDAKTGGVSTQIGLIGAGAIAAAGALGLISGPIKSAIEDAKDLVGWITDKIPGVKTTTIKCVQDPSCAGTAAGGAAGGTTSGKSGGGISKYTPLIASVVTTGAQMLGSAAIGDAISNYVLGPSFEGISGLLGGGTPFKSYHGLLDIIGLGNQDYEVLNYNDKITSEARKVGATTQGAGGKPIGEVDWSLIDNIKNAFTSGAEKGTPGGVENVKWLKDNVFNKLSGKGIASGIGSAFSGLMSIGGSGEGGFNFMDLIFPKGASAAGTGGKSNIMGDLFGKNGALDFSRFGLKIPDIKWPNTGQIFNGIKDTLTSHIPKLNWEIPTIGSIGNWIRDKITSLGWKIPSIGSVGAWVQDKINWMLWQIPSLGSVGQWVIDKITWLSWQIPTAGEILGYIKGIIPPFSWPWGPGAATVAASTAGNIGTRANQLISQARGPRGPLTDSVVGSMSALSGVDSGYVSQAMASNFSGVPGFTPIANALSDHLSYQFYYGDGKSDSEVWSSGTCNCYDGAQLLETEAGNRFGLSTGLANGLWDGTSIAHTWSVIGGQPFDMAAKLLRGQWNPPSGPTSNFDKLMMDIGPGLEYEGYGGHKYDPISAITSRGNCFDMTLGVMNMAAAYGLPSEMIWGTYQNNSHVWARVAGRDYDPSRMALERTYSPPPWGPSGNDSGGVHFHKGAIKIEGPIYGIDDLDSRIENGFTKAQEKATKKRKRRTFGG